MGYKWRVYKVSFETKSMNWNMYCVYYQVYCFCYQAEVALGFFFFLFILLSFFINLKPAVSDLQLSLFCTQLGGQCSGRPFSLSALPCQPCKLWSKGCSRAGNAEGRKTFSIGALQSACTKSPWQGMHGSACTREQPGAELRAQMLSCTPVSFKR